MSGRFITRSSLFAGGVLLAGLLPPGAGPGAGLGEDAAAYRPGKARGAGVASPSAAVLAGGQDDGGGDLVPVELATVGVDPNGAPIVLLRDPASGSVVPIWVGQPEAQAILLALHGVTVPRPMTHDLMANLLAEVGAEVEEVRVHDLRGSTYIGAIRLRLNGEEQPRTVDSRPSDALALALRTDAPIRVARKILVDAQSVDLVAPDGPGQIVQTLGITVVSATPELRAEHGLPDRPGVVVTGVTGRAQELGLRAGDLVVAVNGEPVAEPIEFFRAVRATPAGGAVRLTYWRDGQEQQIGVPADLPPTRRGRERQLIV